MAVRTIPTVENVIRDTLYLLTEREKSKISTIDIANGDIVINQKNLTLNVNDVHEVCLFISKSSHRVPGPNEYGGLPLYSGFAYLYETSIFLYFGSVSKNRIEISYVDHVEYELNGPVQILPLPDKLSRKNKTDNIRNCFKYLRPIVRKNRISKEIQNICQGGSVFLPFESMTFSRDNVTYTKLKSGFLNKLANRKDTLTTSYSNILVSSEGDDFTPAKVTVSIAGDPDAARTFTSSPPDDYGEHYLIKPIVDFMNGNNKNMSMISQSQTATTRLKELSELERKGFLTKDEYEQKRKQIVSDL